MLVRYNKEQKEQKSRYIQRYNGTQKYNCGWLLTWVNATEIYSNIQSTKKNKDEVS